MRLLRETCRGPLGSHAARGPLWGQASRGAAPAGRLWWAPAELCMQRWTPCSAVPLGMFYCISAVQSSTQNVHQQVFCSRLAGPSALRALETTLLSYSLHMLGVEPPSSSVPLGIHSVQADGPYVCRHCSHVQRLYCCAQDHSQSSALQASGGWDLSIIALFERALHPTFATVSTTCKRCCRLHLRDPAVCLQALQPHPRPLKAPKMRKWTLQQARVRTQIPRRGRAAGLPSLGTAPICWTASTWWRPSRAPR